MATRYPRLLLPLLFLASVASAQTPVPNQCGPSSSGPTCIGSPSGQPIELWPGLIPRVRFDGVTFYPIADNTITLGDSTHRFKDPFFSGTATFADVAVTGGITPSTIKADYGSSTPLTFTDPPFFPYAERTGAWFRSIGTAASQRLAGVAAYAAASNAGATMVRGGLFVADVPTTVVSAVGQVRGSTSESDCESSATVTECTGTLSWAFAQGDHDVTNVYGSRNEAFQIGSGAIASLVGVESIVERDPGGTGAVTSAFAVDALISDSIGTGWGTGDVWGMRIQQTGGNARNAYGVRVGALAAGTAKYSFYGVDRIHTDGGLEGASLTLTSLAASATAPTIAAGGCTSPAVTWNNGTAAFKLTIGTSCTGIKTITLTLPAATNGWVCTANDVTTPASFVIAQHSSNTTTVVLGNYARTTGLAADFADSEAVLVKCSGG